MAPEHLTTATGQYGCKSKSRSGNLSVSCVCDDAVELQAGDPIEMAKVPGNQLQIMAHGCSCNLYVRIRKDHARVFEMSTDPAENLRNADVVRQNRDGGQNSLFDI